MATYYFDTSALLKRYVVETGTQWVRSPSISPARHDIFVARLVQVELTAAIARRRSGSTLSAAAASTILRRFGRHLVNQYRIMEVSADLELNSAATAEGIAAEDPNMHP